MAEYLTVVTRLLARPSMTISATASSGTCPGLRRFVSVLDFEGGEWWSQVVGAPLVRPHSDLTVIACKTGRAAGQVIEVTGRVLNGQGHPIAGARVEVWQANTHGRYTHPSDRNPAPLDPNFEGYAVLQTDAEGRYRFKTIKPAAYPEDSGARRAPHIHFDVLGRSNRLVTQMFFAGETLNDTDRFLQTAGANRNRLVVPFARGPRQEDTAALVGVWDIEIDQG